MAPVDDLHAQVSQNTKRLDAHDAILHEHGERMNAQGDGIRRLTFLLLGDKEGGVDGLVGAVRELTISVERLVEKQLEADITWDVTKRYFVLFAVLMGLIAAGQWWPQIEILLKVFGGIP